MGSEEDGFIARMTKKIQDTREEMAKFKKLSDAAMSEEQENFLFLAAGAGKIIKGMHYPDSAFIDGRYPLMYKTSDENVIVAAWPRKLIHELMTAIEENNPEESWDLAWNDMLQELLDKSVENIKDARDIFEDLS